MNAALEMLRKKRSEPPVIEERTGKRRLPENTLVADFFTPPLSQSLQTKPSLPQELQPFCYLYRMAVRGAIPADRAQVVLQAIDRAGDVLEGKRKGRLLYEDAMETLTEQARWLDTWTEDLEAGEDPFEDQGAWE